MESSKKSSIKNKDDDNLVGQSLGQFKVLAEIGKGGMATVYRARQETIGRDVALKVLPKRLGHDSNFFERFQREVQTISRLQHPHILPVYEYGEHDGMPFIVMALIDGGTLADRIRQSPLSLSDAVKVVRQMALAIDHAHHNGVIHRDLKPSNVLFDKSGNGYLSDFGIAEMTAVKSRLTGTAIIGSPAYIAPELARPNGLSPAVDVYALGVSLYRILSGRLPYQAETPLGVMMAHATEPIPDVRDYRPDLPSTIQDIIARALAKDPDQRFPTAGLLADALDELERGSEDQRVAMLFSNQSGQIIFVDTAFLKMIHLKRADTRNVVGRPMHEVLGLEKQQIQELMQKVCKAGQVDDVPMQIRTTSGSTVDVSCQGVANYDDNDRCIGIDLKLAYILSSINSGDEYTMMTMAQGLTPSSQSRLSFYFSEQFQAQRLLMMEVGGHSLCKSVEDLVDQTAIRNGWPVRVRGGEAELSIEEAKPEPCRALLTKVMSYTISIVGRPLVSKKIREIDQRLKTNDESGDDVPIRLGLLELVDQL